MHLGNPPSPLPPLLPHSPPFLAVSLQQPSPLFTLLLFVPFLASYMYPWMCAHTHTHTNHKYVGTRVDTQTHMHMFYCFGV